LQGQGLGGKKKKKKKLKTGVHVMGHADNGRSAKPEGRNRVNEIQGGEGLDLIYGERGGRKLGHASEY